MNERWQFQTTAERPWSGGRPWHGLPEEGEPLEDLCGTGADLALALADLIAELDGPEMTTVGERARGRLVDAAVAAERVKAYAAWVQARAVADLHRQFVAEDDAFAADLADEQGDPALGRPTSRSEQESFELAGRAASICVSLALGVSAKRADDLLGFALGLDDQPVLAGALREGRLDETQARAVLDSTAALPVEQRTRVVESVAADPDTLARARMVRELRCGTQMVWAIPAHKLRGIINRQIAAVAPESIKSAEQHADESRRVEHYAGTLARPGAIVLRGPEHLLAAAYNQLDQTARAARKAGARDAIDHLRFDLAVGALTNGAFGLMAAVQPKARRSVLIDVVVAKDTLLGLDDDPACLRTLSGDVAISSGLARELADTDATWRRILCDDPATGAATDVSPRYRPGRRVAEFCTVRDGRTSRFPTSGARVLELDHIEEYDHGSPADGGRTTAANLSSAGKRDHQDKTDRLLRVSGNANGVLTYRTAAGHVYSSRPHAYLDPGPDPPY
jgi:hypothetical protein